jgi:ribosomal protein S18 acetylase RimI-like enzyme
MVIRFLSPDDSPSEISRIYEQSWKSAYRGIIPQAWLDSIPAGRWADRITKPGMLTLVAEEDGQLIGTASVCRSRWEEYPDHGEIVSIYFLPEYTGRGFGAPLLRRCTDELHARGFSAILLWVLEENTRARHFYEKNGFSCTAAFREDCIGGKMLRELMYSDCAEDL